MPARCVSELMSQRAGIAAGFTVAGGTGHDHMRWPARQPYILRRVGLHHGNACLGGHDPVLLGARDWPGSAARRAGSTVARGLDAHQTWGPTGRIHRTTHRIASATGCPGWRTPPRSWTQAVVADLQRTRGSGIAAQRNTRLSPPDGAIVESSKGVPLERSLKPGLVGIPAPPQRYPRPSRRGQQRIAADVG